MTGTGSPIMIVGIAEISQNDIIAFRTTLRPGHDAT